MILKSDPEAIEPYLQDASNFKGGQATRVVIPESQEELISFLKDNDDPLTVAGAGTGLTASRIPLTGTIVSLEKFTRLEMKEKDGLVCGPAVRLKEVQDFLKGSGWFYPPNPTENLACMGGTLATNASGSRSYKWGATREFIQAATVVLADGRWVRLERGNTIQNPLILNEGEPIHFPEVSYVSPRCKNAAGYFVQPGMDWLDLFIGSDGTLGMFTEIELKLVPAPENFLSGILFFEKEADCWSLIPEVRKSEDSHLKPCALEYFDRFSLERLRTRFPNVPQNAQAALFFEQDVYSEEEYEAALEVWYAFLENKPLLLDESWFAQSERDLALFHDFRHQVPLMINEENSRQKRVKIGTDMAVDDAHFTAMMKFYAQTLEQGGVPYVMFGHIGDNHLHINLLPGQGEQESAKQLYSRMVDQVLEWHGTVSAEHGIGKLKKDFYHRMVGEAALQDLKRIKTSLDPCNRLGRGNLI